MLRNLSKDAADPGGLSSQANGLCTGLNGGYQALGIAVLAGAKSIVLLGYDMHYPGGRSHWHDGHYQGGQKVVVGEHMYAHGYTKYFRSAAPLLKERGVHVVNATPGSKLGCFPFDELCDVFPVPPQ